MGNFNIGDRIIFNRNGVKYLGQIIDHSDNSDSYYIIKCDNFHTFCHTAYLYDKTNAKYIEVHEDFLTLSQKQIEYSEKDMVTTVSGKYVPKDICCVEKINGEDVYFTYTDRYNFFICEHCGKVHSVSDVAYIRNSKRKICQSCAKLSSDIQYCDECNSYYAIDSAPLINGKHFCVHCFNRKHNVIDEYHTYKVASEDNGYTYYGDTCYNTFPYLGFELETENLDGDDLSNVCAYEIHEIFDSNNIEIATEDDGSLDCGFEFITAPMTYNYHKSISTYYEKMISIYHKYNMGATDSCGLHVHINRNYFEDEIDNGILNILTIFDKFWDELTVFSRREIENLYRWAKKPLGTPKEFLNKNNKYDGERYTAVNLTNKHTIEFRIFSSTTDWDTLKNTLSLVNNIAIISKYMNNNDIINKLTWENLLSESFAIGIMSNNI